jgi:hypothetical protein
MIVAVMQYRPTYIFIGYVSQAEGDGVEIEAGVFERKVLGIALDETDLNVG